MRETVVAASTNGSGTGAQHALEIGVLEQRLRSDARTGLTAHAAEERLAQEGPNRLRGPSRPSYATIAARQIVDPLVLLLLAAAAVSAAVGDGPEALAIAAVVVLNAAIGFALEMASERALLALAESYEVPATVVRDGRERPVAGADVVRGDLLVVRAGARVAADARVVASSGLEVDEAALTGESLPVEKRVEPAPGDAPLAERPAMLFAGTAVTRGSGRGLVCATGPRTQLGQIQELASAAKPPKTPLERRLGLLARQMVGVGVVVTVVLAGIMVARGASVHAAFLLGVAVAVAAVPEGLVASITGALAIGSRALARRGAILRRLDAIETLGQTTVICTDKTGTLTEGRMRVAAVRPAEGLDDLEVLKTALLASSPAVEDTADPQLVADAVDAALLLATLDRGSGVAAVTSGLELVRDVPFTSERGRSTTIWSDAEQLVVATKGAPEILGRRSEVFPSDLQRVVDTWTDEGLRVLAVGVRRLPADAPSLDDADRRLQIVGVVALADPLRAAAPAAVAAAQRAGIAVAMVTGDHPRTARTIARALGLPPERVFARTAPEEKLRLVERLQARGEVVAVTGDGINDAPALRRADVGIAMGGSGTQAARESAALVLTDDDFATIVAAIAGGRRIGDNIKKVIAFLLSANLGEVLLFAVAVTAGLGVPMAVIQVLLVNLVTDGLPALALAQDPATPETMTTAPRRQRTLFGSRAWLGLVLIGVAVGGVATAAYLIGRGSSHATGQTMAFATIACAELVFVFSCRSWQSPPWRLPANRWLLGAVTLSLALVLGAVYMPVMHEPLGTISLSGAAVVTVLGLALVPAALTEAGKAMLRRRTLPTVGDSG